jgi:hypothetical protein
VHFKGRDLIDPQLTIVVEIALLDTAFGEGNAIVERGRQPENHAALDLGADRIGVDLDAAVDSCDDAMKPDASSFIHRDLDDECGTRVEILVQRDAAAAAWWKRRTPARFRRGEIEHRERAWLLAQKRPPIGDGIAAGLVGEFVHEAFDDESVVGRADASPPIELDGRIMADPVHPDGRQVVGRIPGAIDRILIEPSLRPSALVEILPDRSGRDAVGPGNRQAVGAEPGGHAIVIGRPEAVVPNILLARPDDLDGVVDLPGKGDRLLDRIGLKTPAETPADQVIVDTDLVLGQPDDARSTGLRNHRGLSADPDVAAVRTDMDGRVDRLHRRVREKRQFIYGFDPLLGSREGAFDVPHEQPCDGLAGR